MKTRLIVCTTLTAGFLTFAGSPARALDAWQYTFDYGTANPDKVADAVASKVYEDVPAATQGHTVRYLHLESFERSQVTSRAQQTVFCYSEAKYLPTIQGGETLASVTLSYVILDYQGQLQPGGKSWVVRLNAQQPAKNTTEAGPGAKVFYQQIPPWARTQLHLVSGYLENNPGRPVLHFEKNSAETLGSVIEAVVSLAPSSGVIKGAFGEVVENALKTSGAGALRKALQTDELRHGFDYRVRDDQILTNRALYEKAGAKMWSFAQEK